MGFAKFYHVIACPYAATSLWKTCFPPLPLNRNAHHLLSFHGPFLPANLQKICMKLDGRQVETPLNMNPTCTDQTWSRSSRSCRKILLPDVPMAHPPRFPPKSNQVFSYCGRLATALRHLGGSIVKPYLREFKWATCSDCSAGLSRARHSTR